jgi:hypothetical protein
MKELCPREDALLLEDPIVRTFGKPEKTCSGAWGHPHVGSSDKGRKFQPPKVFGGGQNFRHT